MPKAIPEGYHSNTPMLMLRIPLVSSPGPGSRNQISHRKGGLFLMQGGVRQIISRLFLNARQGPRIRRLFQVSLP